MIYREEFIEMMVSDPNCSWLLSIEQIKTRMQEEFGDEETIHKLEMQNQRCIQQLNSKHDDDQKETQGQ